MKKKPRKDAELTTQEDWGVENVQQGEIEDEGNTAGDAESAVQNNLLKRVLSWLGIGALVVGGGALFSAIGILQFLFTAIAGIGMIWWAVVLFSEGSIILGLLVLLIGTPIAIGLAHFFFYFSLIIGVLAAIIWGIANLFGIGLSFGNAWDIIWLVIKVLLLGGMAFLGIGGLIGARKENRIGEFFKENWFYILLFVFLFWLFFL